MGHFSMETLDLPGSALSGNQQPGFPLFVADRIPYWRISPWKTQIRDVRDLHFGRERLRLPYYPQGEDE